MKHSQQEIDRSQVNHIRGLIKSAKKAGLEVIIKIPTQLN